MQSMYVCGGGGGDVISHVQNKLPGLTLLFLIEKNVPVCSSSCTIGNEIMPEEENQEVVRRLVFSDHRDFVNYASQGVTNNMNEMAQKARNRNNGQPSCIRHGDGDIRV